VKAAAGAVEHVPVAPVAGIPAALERARRAEVWTVGLAAEGRGSVFDLTVADQPLMLVLGAEGRGLARLTRERCDLLAGIPMPGPVDSLNVATAAAVACFEVVRRRSAGGRAPA
jgi:23S rRNA (guanosine2251-2'-O)-methyltransferase